MCSADGMKMLQRIFRAGSGFMESSNRAIRTHGKLIIGKAFELLHDEEFHHLVNQQPGGTECQQSDCFDCFKFMGRCRLTDYMDLLQSDII